VFYYMAETILGTIAAATTKAQNAEWFAADLAPGVDTAYGSLLFISFSVDAAVGVEVTLDSGTTWVALSDKIGGIIFAADQSYLVPQFVRSGDTVNFRIPTAGGADINFCRVDEST